MYRKKPNMLIGRQKGKQLIKFTIPFKNFSMIKTSTAQRIEIPLNKSKIVLMLVGSIALVGVGLWFVISPPTIRNSYWGDPTKLAIVGYASIVFFGFLAFIFLRKLPDQKPGLIIDETGLTDNSGGLSAGTIPWADIEDISVLEIHKNKMIMIYVKDPQEYINRQSNVIKRKLMHMNNNSYGTPISITTNGLKTSFDDLFGLLIRKFEETRSNT